MNMRLLCAFVLLGSVLAVSQQPFLDSHQWIALRDEASGAVPYENLSIHHAAARVPATAQFDDAAQFILQRAREYGLADVHAEQFPVDGKTQYGLMRSYFAWNRGKRRTLGGSSALDREAKARGAQGTNPISPWANDADARRIPVRTSNFGPLTYQNDDVLVDRLGRDRVNKIKLLNSEATPLFNVQDQSELYAYEMFNFVDGKRTAGEIRDAVSAEYGPLPIDLVSDYLNACSEAKLLSWK
jgi:hypothetical protein